MLKKKKVEDGGTKEIERVQVKRAANPKLEPPPNMTSEAYRRYVEEAVKFVQDTSAKAGKLNASAIESYWAIGSFADTLDSKSGEGVVEKFAADIASRLRAKGGDDYVFPLSTVYDCRTFFRAFPAVQKQRLIDLGVGWKYAKALSSSNVSQEARYAAIEALADGSIAQRQIPAAVRLLTSGGSIEDLKKEHSESTKSDKTPADRVVSSVRSLSQISAHLVQKCQSKQKRVTTRLASLGELEKAAIKPEIDEARNQVLTAIGALKQILTELESHGSK